MRVWIVMWFEDMDFAVFSSRKRAWNYLCEYYERINELDSKEFNDLKNSYEEEKNYFGNENIIVAEKLIDER